MKLKLNIIFGFIEALVQAVLLFLLYRFLIDNLSIATIGVWSLVMATVSLSQVGNFGVAKSLMYFLPRAIHDKDYPLAVKYVETLSLTIVGSLSLLALIIYLPAQALLTSVADEPQAKLDAIALLPWALFSFVISNLLLVPLSALRAIHKNYLASSITIFGGITQYVMALVYVPDYGVIAMAWAQVVQSILMLVFAWLLLMKLLPGTPLIFHRFSKPVFKDAFKYGMKLQFMSLITMLIQPTTKYFLGIFASLEAVGYFEFADRMMQRFSKLITQASVALIPAIAELSKKGNDQVADLLHKANAAVFCLSPVLIFGLLAGLPGIAWLWVKDPYSPFVLYSLILGMGMMVSLAASPSYNLGKGLDKLGPNIRGVALYGGCNVALGALLGWQFGGIGVVSGLALANVIAQSYIIIGNMHGLVGWSFVSRKVITMTVLLMAAGGAAVYAAHQGFAHFWPDQPWTGVFTTLAISGVVIVPVMWLHPGWQFIWQQIKRKRRQPVTAEVAT